jgi:hypothetical protein
MLAVTFICGFVINFTNLVTMIFTGRLNVTLFELLNPKGDKGFRNRPCQNYSGKYSNGKEYKGVQK